MRIDEKEEKMEMAGNGLAATGKDHMETRQETVTANVGSKLGAMSTRLK